MLSNANTFIKVYDSIMNSALPSSGLPSVTHMLKFICPVNINMAITNLIVAYTPS